MNELKGIAEWASNVQIEIAEESAETVRAIFRSVIKESPYKTGRFLANWHIGNSNVDYSATSTSNHSKKLAEINFEITDDYFLRNTSAFIVNNVSYAKEVEEDGWRKTGPYAPIAKTLAKFPSTD